MAIILDGTTGITTIGLTADTNLMFLDVTNNYVGINTASPNVTLDVNNTTSIIKNTSTAGTTQVALNQSNFSGNFYTGLDNNSGSYLTGQNYAGFHWMTGSYPMIFATANTERMRIDSSGNVGIGTGSPGAKFEVKGGATDNATININNNNGNIWKLWNDNGANGLNVQYNGVTQLLVTSAGLLQFNSGYGSVATSYGCRAWVNFNGTTASPSTIRGSGNVTSVTKNATGDYTINFTNAMPDVNYGVNGAAGWGAAANPTLLYNVSISESTAPTASALRIAILISTGAKADTNFVNVSVIR